MSACDEGPMRIDPAAFVPLPYTCPYCGTGLEAEIVEWCIDDQKVTDFRLVCPEAEFGYHLGLDEVPLIVRVQRWLERNVRVKEEP